MSDGGLCPPPEEGGCGWFGSEEDIEWDRHGLGHCPYCGAVVLSTQEAFQRQVGGVYPPNLVVAEASGSNMYDGGGDKVPTWNPLVGECVHSCSYCYIPDMVENNPVLRKLYNGPIRLNPNAFKKAPAKRADTMVFVGNMADVFAKGVPTKHIKAILGHCDEYPDKTYLFQTKNPRRFIDFMGEYPPKTILATTIETNRQDTLSKYSMAPRASSRKNAMTLLRHWIDEIGHPYETMVTLEPIMDLDVGVMVDWMRRIKPDIMYIGADSKLVCDTCGYGTRVHDRYRWRGRLTCPRCESRDITNAHRLPEPSRDKTLWLIERLRGLGINVQLKDNLRRIIEEEED